MGAFGCKYCDCDKGKMEDTTEEMQINYNTPIVITANKPTNKNNKGKDDTISKNNEDFNSLSIQINSDIDTIQKDNFSNEISTNNFETNNNINNLVKDMINSNKINSDNIIEESPNEFELNHNKESSTKNININKDNNISLKNLNYLNDEVDTPKLNDNLKFNINIMSSNNEKDNNNENDNDNDNIIKENALSNTNKDLKESKTAQLYITSPKEAKKKIEKYEIDKIQFGLGKNEKEKFNKEQKKLYNEAENNLKQFNPPQGHEVNNIQKIMSNIILNLKSLINGNNINFNLYDSNYILLNGTLKKMINYEINSYKPTMYSEKFCVVFPNILKFYKSKAQFLKNLKPMFILPINQISAINIAKPKKSPKKIYHLIICNKFGIKKNCDNSIFLNLFDSQELNEYLVSSDINESLLIFTADDEKEVYKWYVILQFLVEFSKIKE